MALYRLLEAVDLTSPTLVAAFDGWIDAGGAALAAASQLAARGRVVARFDPDRLYDYRVRRPTLEIVDGRLDRLTWADLTLRAVRLGDRHLLVLAGPEPDFAWHALVTDVLELMERLDVAEWITLGALPAAVPHTRPVPVWGSASRPEFLRGGVEAGPSGVLRVPAACLSVLEKAVADAGRPALGYYAQVPHYVSGPYPAAAVALLEVLGRHLGTTIDPGPLAEEARLLARRLDAATRGDESTRAYVERLEAMADEDRLPSGDELIAEIERFLRERGGDGPRSDG